MRNAFKLFCKSEDGAVTVDWVVLTGGICTLGAVIALGVREAATAPASSIEARLTAMTTD